MCTTNRYIITGLTAFIFVGLAGCASHHTYYEQLWDQEEIAQFNHDDLFLVEHDDRLYVFDDTKVYQDFISGGETSYRLTRIGEGPGGSTLVFGLRGKDKDKKSGIGAMDLFSGKLAPFKRFYGEYLTDKQIVLFDNVNDLKKAMSTPSNARTTPLMGPTGQPVFVSATNPANESVLIETYRTLHAKK